MTINYHNALADIDTHHLSEKGAEQVQGYAEYIRPRYESIKSGELTKEEVARYWIDKSMDYTDGAKKLLENVNDALGISKSYLSQIKTVDKFIATYLDDDKSGIPAYVLEHPVSVRYYLCKMQHEDLWTKFLTGNHFTKREAQSKVYPGKPEPIAATEETLTEFQKQLKMFDELVEDESYEYIKRIDAAKVYTAGTLDGVIGAFAEKISRLSIVDERRKANLRHIIGLCNEALKKPSTFQYSLTGNRTTV